jgi:hypothetical protein
MQRDYTQARAENYLGSAFDLHQHKQSTIRTCMGALAAFVVLGALPLLVIAELDQTAAFALWLSTTGAVLLILGLGAASYMAQTAFDTRILYEIHTARTQHAHRRHHH